MTTHTSHLLRRLFEMACLVILAGCSKDDILRPDVPDVISPDDLNNALGAPAIYAGAVSDLVFATTGQATGVAIYAGLFTDELMHASTPPAVREWDLRNVLSTNSVAVAGLPNPGPFLALQRARTALEGGAAKVSTLVAADDKRVGELWALAGMSYILFGEMFCSGTPFSERDPTVELGTPLTTDEMFNRALDRLTTAATSTGGDATVTNLIAVLRGRALLDLGQSSQAAAAVAAVPTGFAYQFIHANPPARQNNNIYLQNSNDIYSVSDREGTNGLDFASANDPRVPVTAPRPSRNDGVTPQVYFRKYTSLADPVTMASGIEARLIEAEAALPGDPGTWLSKLNEARATVSGLAPLSDPGTTDTRVDLTFRERGFWMYLTGHRLGDLRRLVRQYGRARESVYPTGAYHKQGLTRGTQATLRVPQPEVNNPNYTEADCTHEIP